MARETMAVVSFLATGFFSKLLGMMATKTVGQSELRSMRAVNQAPFNEMMNSQHHSQFGQEEYLDTHLFRGETGLFYVEVGAADPVELSNTYFLETQRGWKGIQVEARPEACLKLKAVRSSDVVNACISERPGRSIFFDYGVLGGLCKFMSEREHEYLEQYCSNEQRVRAYWVDTLPLSEVIATHDVTSIDLLAIDVEGAEISVLSTLDFAAVKVEVVMVEANTQSAAKLLDELLIPKGFVHVHTCGVDRIYVHESSRYMPLD